MPLMFKVVDPLLVSVTDFCAPLLPTATEAHESEVGLTDALPLPVPVVPRPERVTF